MNFDVYWKKKTVLRSKESLITGYPWYKVFGPGEPYRVTPNDLKLVKKCSKTPKGGPRENYKILWGISISVIYRNKIENRNYKKCKNELKIAQNGLPRPKKLDFFHRKMNLLSNASPVEMSVTSGHQDANVTLPVVIVPIYSLQMRTDGSGLDQESKSDQQLNATLETGATLEDTDNLSQITVKQLK